MLGIKRIENRSWPAPPALIGHRIAIHGCASPCALRSWSEIVTGRTLDPNEDVTVAGIELPPLPSLPRGAILGTVELHDCCRFHELPRRLKNNPFAEPGCYCWLLRDPQPLVRPIACRGALRLWPAPAALSLED